MKRIIIGIILAIGFCFSFYGCGNGANIEQVPEESVEETTSNELQDFNEVIYENDDFKLIYVSKDISYTSWICPDYILSLENTSGKYIESWSSDRINVNGVELKNSCIYFDNCEANTISFDDWLVEEEDLNRCGVQLGDRAEVTIYYSYYDKDYNTIGEDSFTFKMNF